MANGKVHNLWHYVFANRRVMFGVGVEMS